MSDDIDTLREMINHTFAAAGEAVWERGHTSNNEGPYGQVFANVRQITFRDVCQTVDRSE